MKECEMNDDEYIQVGNVCGNTMADKCYKYQWQVLYQKGAFEYWWDYPPDVCGLLDQSRAEKDSQIIVWIWEWEKVEGKPSQRTTYHIDTLAMQQFLEG